MKIAAWDCLAAGALVFMGCLVGLTVERAKAEFTLESYFILIPVSVVCAGAGVLLLKHRRLAYLPAKFFFIFMLFGFPIGTLIGVSGLSSLKKCKHLLK